MTGRFYGVGLGPGDPELITLKAARIIGAADVVAYHAGVNKQSYARGIAADLIPDGVIEEELRYPVTTGSTDHPGGYAGALADFYEESAQRLATHLAAGRTVALLAEGDPLFYGSYMYMHDRLSSRFPTEVVPGLPAFLAATATTASPLVRQTDVLTVLPGTLPEPELARRLADTDGAIIMKLGRTFPAVRRALAASGRLPHALYVERASHPEERWMPVADVDETSVPYLSLIVVNGDSLNGSRSRVIGELLSTTTLPATEVAELLVVGLGPGPDEWLTPEAAAVLAEVDHVVGYGPYVARVPQREGLQRHASGNTVEVDRARFALDLARRGERVAVVSGGDAGVFGMAAAVFEAAEDERYADVPIRVVPGVSAVQAVAALAGAPIGADFAVLSLSDRLKPWAVIETRLRAIAEADLVLGIYNPASRTRPDQIAAARKVLLEHRSADTVVVVGRDVGRAEQSLTVTTLGDLDTDVIDMKCLLLIGASHTRVTASGRVWTPRWVQ
ncbi:precorrin-3B C(17)-methyltransferase [Mycolicibacterium madagascariense]|uniref:Precorrin-3B C(17)-methyltransferase n=1 Tax=Mycolicibacterium madagascariense TaxID=212765 RepID=A0A7I7XDF1_9MYCO|nr:precorrin-2 C(20)-methyltransferase [Mycolicibacterium madagascariense]MCV7011292.1 precorrin-2 C(20)-methyltransferase [Mycolicibacterium madagascariense]BBZ26671.1 precorrin-3B C(17)-methyltransferase [Mycolicibacterium madagascariense]